VSTEKLTDNDQNEAKKKAAKKNTGGNVWGKPKTFVGKK